jgi:hypothetical protein
MEFVPETRGSGYLDGGAQQSLKVAEEHLFVRNECSTSPEYACDGIGVQLWTLARTSRLTSYIVGMQDAADIVGA